jgi:hypothetical protein
MSQTDGKRNDCARGKKISVKIVTVSGGEVCAVFDEDVLAEAIIIAAKGIVGDGRTTLLGEMLKR